MSLSILTPSRAVLMISDEALSIYSTGMRGVRLIETVPWDAEDFESDVATILSKDCRGKPVLILNDMVEQHYRKERVQKVGALDKANILQRKLNVTFPSYPIRAALPLKEKIPKSEKMAAASIYIFAAVPGSEPFNKTMAAVGRSLQSVSGFGLLPIESSDMVKTLGQKLDKQHKTKAKWVVFMGQHRNGSLRQIVTKNGELALTRMTPISDADENVASWAAEIGQEFKATMSYLTRFGYAPDDGLNVILIAEREAGSLVENALDTACHFTALSVAEAAKLLNIPIGPQDSNYADLLHVAWAGRKTALLLPMKAKAIESVSRPRQVAMAASLLLLMGAAFQGYQMMDKYQANAIQKSDLEAATQNKAQLDVQYQKEVKRKEELGFDVKLMQSALAVHEALEKTSIKPLDVFSGVGRALGPNLKLDKVLLQKPDEKLTETLLSVGGQQSRPLYEASLLMTFPSTTDIIKGNDEVRNLRDRLQSTLPGNAIEVMKFLKDYEYTEKVVVETGSTQAQNVSQDFTAEIFMKGPPI